MSAPEWNHLPPPPAAGRYRSIVVDPPWDQGKTGRRKVRPAQGTRLEYPTVTAVRLESLPVAEWAAPQSFIWLWATNSKERSTGAPILRLAFDLLEAWGFTYYTTITWNKKTGPCPFGPYQVTTEHALFGYRGKARFARESLGKLQTCFSEPVLGHSVKPASFYQAIAQFFPGPRLDVFARAGHAGFDGWGDEFHGSGGGGGGIRTHEGLRPAGFQDRSHQPLDHPS